MTRQAASIDPAERARLFREAQTVFNEHLPALYFAAPRVYVAVGPRVRNLTPALNRRSCCGAPTRWPWRPAPAGR